MRERFYSKPEDDYSRGTFKSNFYESTSSLIERNFSKGFHFGWEKESFWKLYLNVFPNYSMNGFVSENHLHDFSEINDSGLFLELGFIRQIKMTMGSY